MPMTDRADSLRALIEAVEAGKGIPHIGLFAAAFPAETPYGDDPMHKAARAYDGSLDAALALHACP